MQAPRLAVPALALAVILSAILLALGLATVARTANDAPRPTPNDYEPAAGLSPEGAPRKVSQKKTLSASTPAKDVAGKPISGLSRHPGSVRVAYAEGRADGLRVVRAGYAAEKPPTAVRDFYTGLFRSEGWGVANVEYMGGEWHFLAVRGGREAVVEVSPRSGGSLVKIEASRPLAQEGVASAGGSKR